MNILSRQLLALMETDARWLPVFSNASALLMQELKDINWAGFYILEDAEIFHIASSQRQDGSQGGRLVLGPFQGKTACIHIPVGKGVCGTALQKNQTLRVPDVHAFPGHIACDSATNSEIVIPIHNKTGRPVGVLDIDSTVPDRFSQKDQSMLEEFVKVLEHGIMEL